jgi:hypothetical protein
VIRWRGKGTGNEVLPYLELKSDFLFFAKNSRVPLFDFKLGDKGSDKRCRVGGRKARERVARF